ncbi:hypothetical protein L596_021583 [Steinernema carpocapsae]|uniref:Uncharacterized protein n=1 Tax=Steinernema carpocapsae TaxID=34508 RepID=A0A4U5MJ83_STECR|nr:hypothetical protein L596_021583 [Steinernema carpocapsae]
MVTTTTPISGDSSDGEVSELCLTIVKASLLFFGFFGGFRKCQYHCGHLSQKIVKSKCGLLLAILAFCDMWCLLFELLSAVRLLTNTAEMSRIKCFWSISLPDYRKCGSLCDLCCWL